MNMLRIDRPRVLLVEDDVLIRMLLADMLGEIGYTVAAEAGTAAKALAARVAAARTTGIFI